MVTGRPFGTGFRTADIGILPCSRSWMLVIDPGVIAPGRHDLSRSGASTRGRLDQRVLPVAVLDHEQAFVLGPGTAEQWLQPDRGGLAVGAADPMHGPARQIVPWSVSRAVADLAGTKLFEIVWCRHA